MRFRFINLRKIDWAKLYADKKLKFNIGLAIVLVIFFAFFIDIVYSIYRYKYYREEGVKPAPHVQQQKEQKPKRTKIEAKLEPRQEAKPREFKKAKVAIILDDAGSRIPDYGYLKEIKEPLTIAVIPHLPTSAQVAKDLKERGFEIMLHIPMEPDRLRYVRYDSGMVLCSSSDSEIRQTVSDDYDWVKIATGANNHLGSKATSNERVMKDVLEFIKDKKMFFVDSRTSGSSVAFKMARDMKIRSTENNVFLDGDTSEAAIIGRLRELISMARRKGSAVGIGHITRHPTLNVLKRYMSEYAKEGIQFVYASELAK